MPITYFIVFVVALLPGASVGHQVRLPPCMIVDVQTLNRVTRLVRWASCLLTSFNSSVGPWACVYRIYQARPLGIMSTHLPPEVSRQPRSCERYDYLTIMSDFGFW